MWKNKHSLLLSRVSILLFFIVDIVGIATGYWILKWFMGFSRADIQDKFWCFVITCYLCSIFVTIALFMLNFLLKNIQNEHIFIVPNVKYIKICSWCCICVAVICFVSALYYLPFAIVSIAAAFMGLILRIIKNVFDNAIIIKQDYDLTI